VLQKALCLALLITVRLWTVAAATYRVALARCGRLSLVQAHHRSPPVSAQHSAIVSDRLLCCCLRYCWSSESALITPLPDGGTVLSTNDTQLLGILCRTSSKMRLRTVFGTHWKHCFSDDITCSVLSALEVLMTMRYINWRFTYLLELSVSLEHIYLCCLCLPALPGEAKKLHCFIFAIALSELHLLWQFLEHIYCSKFPVIHIFHILYIIRDVEPA